MNSNLDNIKSTITISLGTKNRLRKLKGSDSYETYINYLIATKNQIIHDKEEGIELQKVSRKKAIYSFESFKLIFSYNKYNNSPHFSFDVSLEKIRDNGKIISIKMFLKKMKQIFPNKEILDTEYGTYFQLLQVVIQKEIMPQFKHKGRFEDYYLWDQEFEKLGLSKTTFEEDVMEKLREFQQKIHIFENGYN